MALDDSGSSRIDIAVRHSPLAFFYGLLTPTITINKQCHHRPWGTHSFNMTPGSYEVSVSYPWLFSSECGKNTVSVTLRAGESKKVTYTAGLIRYLPGKMVVE